MLEMFNLLSNNTEIQSVVEVMKDPSEIIKQNISFEIYNISETDEEIFHLKNFWKGKLYHFLNLRYNFAYYSNCSLSKYPLESSIKDNLLKELPVNERNLSIKELTMVALRYAYYYKVLSMKSDSNFSTPIDNNYERRIKLCVYCDFEISANENKCNICGGEQVTDEERADQEPSNVEINVVTMTQNVNYSIPPDDKWRCQKCEFLNSLDSVTCNACYSKAQWPCGQCSYLNDADVLNCTVCNGGKEDKAQMDRICWNCDAVQRKGADLNFCASCGLDQSVEKKFGYPINKKILSVQMKTIWICPKCHFENEYDDQKCQKCQTNLQ